MQQPLLRFEIENFLLATDNVWDDICTLTVTEPQRRDHKNIRYNRHERSGGDKNLDGGAVAHPAPLTRVHRSVTRGQGHHQADISQSEESSQSADQSEARGKSPISFCDNPRSVLMNVYTSAALRADTLGNEWGLCSQ